MRLPRLHARYVLLVRLLHLNRRHVSPAQLAISVARPHRVGALLVSPADSVLNRNRLRAQHVLPAGLRHTPVHPRAQGVHWAT